MFDTQDFKYLRQIARERDLEKRREIGFQRGGSHKNLRNDKRQRRREGKRLCMDY